VRLELNGKEVELEAAPMARLLDVLRDVCGLLGTKEGCGDGACGACTVLVDGAAVCACLVPVAQVEGASVTTIEALPEGHPLPRAFVDEAGAQCGFCTPGMILAAHELLKHNPKPSDEEIRQGLEGNMCRCTGYQNIVRAVREAATQMAK
jgi:aerobic-type carbon monoxide dehydrogenase small subunit (CoxS/CutS family)